MVCLAIGYPKFFSSYACAITMTILQYTPFSILLFIIVIELYNLTSYKWLVVYLPLLKIWVRQLGSVYSQYVYIYMENSIKIH